MLIVGLDLNSGSVMWDMKSLAHHDLATKYRILGRPLKDYAPYDAARHRRQGELVRPIQVPEVYFRRPSISATSVWPLRLAHLRIPSYTQ
jgi:hypothetical protein